MKPKTNFDNEATIKELNYGGEYLLLTTDRVRHSKTDLGSNDTTSILLSEVCSVSIHSRSFIIFIVLAVFSGIANYFIFESSNADIFKILGILVTATLILAYFLTKKQLLVIASAGGKIEFESTSMKKDDIVDFIDTVEKAKEDKSKRS